MTGHLPFWTETGLQNISPLYSFRVVLILDCAYLMEPFDPGRRPRVPMDQDRNVPKTTAHRITQQQIYSLYMLLASFCIRIF